MVGVSGFEPETSCSQSKHSARLSYTPKRFMQETSIHKIERVKHKLIEMTPVTRHQYSQRAMSRLGVELRVNREIIYVFL